MITLYASNGTEIVSEIRKYSYTGSFMGECFINTTINSDSPIDFNIGDYCVFRGERFELNYIPAKSKTAIAGSFGGAFTYDNIKFNSLADETTTVEFLDVVIQDNEIHGTSLPNFSFYANSVYDLADRIKANLDRVFTGAKKWTIIVQPDLVSPSKSINVSRMSIWDAISMIYNEFEVNFTIRNRVLTIGTSGYAVGAVFGYGKGNGLYDIQQSTNQDAKIITRLRAYGSTRNIPHRYYNNLKDENSNPYILDSLYIPNLMLPDFPYVKNQPKDVFIDSDNVSTYGVREGSVYFDGSDGEGTEIYPSLEGMTDTQLEAAGIIVSLPSGDNGNIDEILGAENPDDDGIVPLEGQGELVSTFKVYLKDLGFDLSEKDEKGQYKYSTSDTMQISMKSGMGVARTFDVVENGIKKDTSLGYTRFIVECNRFIDDSIQGGMAFPNNQYPLESGDKIVILGIDLPDVYIKAAAQRLFDAAQEYLSQNDSTKYTYTPKIDEKFMAENPDIGFSIKEGDIFSFADTDLDIDASVVIQSLKINYDIDKQPIPSYEVSLSNDRISTTIEKMQNSISMLQSNMVGLSIDSIKSLINAVGTSLFISKNFNDTAKGLIKFVKGLDVGEYTEGAFGGGGTLRMNSSGQSYLEVDKLYVRMQAIFRELLIERMSHIGGSQILSLAHLKCVKVEEYDSYYRCYFDTGENGEVVNEFALDDQARCQVFNGSTRKYYWRLVIGVGSDYIDLSKVDFDGNDVPEVDDEIIQLGNRTDESRQNAQILSSFGGDAPSYKQYQGINSYSLEGKEKTVISPSGNKFDGAVNIQAGSLGWENLVGLPEEFDSLATGSVNLIRNSGFTGDYSSKELKPNTDLNANTQLYSEQLLHWGGEATVSVDSDSISGFSATLIDQTISQSVPTINQEDYILSFKAKGESVSVNVSGFTKTQQLTSDYHRYVIKLQSGDTQVLSISGRCTICEIQLERGTVPSEWRYSLLDNDKTLAQFEAIRYITDSVKNGSTSILGGLILSSMIQLGNYINGKLKSVTAGMSGIYNNNNDIAFWAGGDLSKAIANAMNPFTTDVSKKINYLVTHGGLLVANQAIIRGTIFAESGVFKGTVYATDGEFNGKISIAGGRILLNKDGSGQLANGNVTWDTDGNVNVLGTIESNIDGSRIVIDSGRRELTLINSENKITGRINFYEYGGESGIATVPRIILKQIEKNDSVLNTTLISASGIYLYNDDIESEGFHSPRMSFSYGLDGRTSIVLKNCPTSSNGLEVGEFWRNGNVVNIVS